MGVEKIFSFDISTNISNYRMEYTMTSSFTYKIPPKTTIIGLLGSILGIKRKNLEDFQKDIKIGLKILNTPIKTKVWGFNYMYGKGATFKNLNVWYDKYGHLRTNIINYQMIIKPHYRIYVFSENQDKFEKIINRITNKKAYFTPYIGSAYSLISIKNSKIYENIEEIEKNKIADVNSVVAETNGKILDYNTVFFENIPYIIDFKNRPYKKIKIYYKNEEKPIKIKVNRDVYKIGDNEIVCLF